MICNNLTCIHGVCVNRSNEGFCECRTGYYGSYCDFEVNECLSNPCMNNGTCIDQVASFRCQCRPPYTGATCQGVTSESVAKLAVFDKDYGYTGVAVAVLLLLFVALVTALVYWYTQRRKAQILESLLIQEVQLRRRGKRQTSSISHSKEFKNDCKLANALSLLTPDQRRNVAIANVLASACARSSSTKQPPRRKGQSEESQSAKTVSSRKRATSISGSKRKVSGELSIRTSSGIVERRANSTSGSRAKPIARNNMGRRSA
uniref:EGF-like domain-containing protein n=1 Tax=Trichuris muris TaxID=70415 RepID=A0A5S6QBD1_TRIMR